MPSNTFDALKEQKDIPVIMVDAEGFITYINEKFEKTYLWSPSQLIGKLLVTIIPKKLHDAHHLGFSRFLITEQPTLLGKPLPLAMVKGDGSEIKAEHTIYAQKQGKNWKFLATIKPI